jgi:ATP sulfurylase
VSELTEVFVYIFDLFIPTDLTRKEVLKAFEKNKLKPFEFIREIVEDKGVRGIKSVQFYDAIPKGEEFLLEYTVDFANGRIAVKVIGSDDPRRMLREYYSYIEKRFSIR